jgi:hypothetical protein
MDEKVTDWLMEILNQVFQQKDRRSEKTTPQYRTVV